MHDAGESVMEISKETGVTRMTIYNIKNRKKSM
jgi:transposase